MGKPKGARTHEDKLWRIAVVKMSFMLRGDQESPAFKGVYPGLLRDLELTDEEVDRYIESHRDEVERAARGHPPGSAPE